MLLGFGRLEASRVAFASACALQPSSLAPHLQLYSLAPPSPAADRDLSSALARAAEARAAEARAAEASSEGDGTMEAHLAAVAHRLLRARAREEEEGEEEGEAAAAEEEEGEAEEDGGEAVRLRGRQSARTDGAAERTSGASWASQLASRGFGSEDGWLGGGKAGALRELAASELGPRLVAGQVSRHTTEGPEWRRLSAARRRCVMAV